MVGLGLGLGFSGPVPVSGSPPVSDDLATSLAALEAAGKLVCAWFLPTATPSQYLTLSGADVNAWTAAYGTQKVDLAFETAAPQWDATLFSNKGGVTFNGTTQRLLGTGNVANWPDDSSDLYMLAAVRQDVAGATAGNKRCFSYGGNADGRALGRASASSNNRVQAVVAAQFNGTAADFSGAHTVGLFCDIGGTSAVYMDGVSDGTASTASAALTLTRVRLGASNAVTASFFWNGVISCAAILNSTASLSDFTALEALMRARVT